METNRTRRHLFMALVALALLVSAGCAGPTATPAPAATEEVAAPVATEGAAAPEVAAPSGSLTIGVSTNAISGEHNRKLFDTTEAEIKATGNTAVMVNANGDPTKQVADIETLIQRKVDALIVQNGDQAALATVIQQAADAGIPVVSVETGDVPGVSVYVSANEFIIGATIATYLSAQIGNEGEVAVMYHNNHPAIRTRGLEIEAVLKENTGLQNVAYHQSVWPGTTEDAYSAMENILAAHPNIVAVFCSQDLEAIGVARAIQAAGRNDIITIGVDGEADALQIIKEGGPIIATVITDVPQESKLSVEAAIRLANGETLASRVIFIPFNFVTKDNVDEYIK